MPYIYITTNLINGKKYIGKSTRNSAESRNYYGGGDILKAAIKKYGFKNFKKEIIVEGNFNKVLLNELETQYIHLHAAHISKKFYNVSRGGIYDSHYHKDSNHKSFNRKVYQYDNLGKLIKIHKNSREAAKHINGVQGSLMNAIAKKCPYKNFFFAKSKISVSFDIVEKIYKPKKSFTQKGKNCFVFTLEGRFVEKTSSIKACAVLIGVPKDTIRHAYKTNIPVGEYVICKTNNFTVNRKSKTYKAVAIYNELECNLFFKHKEASKFLMDKFPNLPKSAGLIRHILNRGYKIGEFSVRELFVESPLIADKNCNGWIPSQVKEKIVYRYSKTGELLDLYESITSAALILGLKHSTLLCNITERSFNGQTQSFYSYNDTFDNLKFTTPKSKPVEVYDENNNLLITCSSKKEATDYIGVPDWRLHKKNSSTVKINNYIIKLI